MALMIPAAFHATAAAAQGTVNPGSATQATTTARHHHHHHAGTVTATGAKGTKSRAAPATHGPGDHRHPHHHATTGHPAPSSAHARHAEAPPHHPHGPPPHGAAHGFAATATRHAGHAAGIATGAAVGVAAGVATGTAAVGGAAPAGGTTLPTDVPPAAGASDKGTVTGLPLPRFAALRADEVNMRSGPGQRYPIQWVYHRRDLPVEIEREFDVWRLVEDSDGQKGWVHQATLVGTRTFVVPGLPPVDPTQPTTPPAAGTPSGDRTGGTAPADPTGHSDTRIVGRLADPAEAATIPGAVMLRSSADAASSVVAVLRPGAVGTFRTCAAGTTWCRVSVQHYSGWLDRRSVWGLLPQETIQPS
ncbi:SH3 domain-containing protein [Gluconacetobacter tumulisoli]